MDRVFLSGKIHRATVTATRLDYEGSLSVDASLLEAASILPFEQVQVYDLSNGNRFETYAIAAAPGSGEIVVNGAAARLARPGDLVIIAAYARLSPEEIAAHRPRIVVVDKKNRPSKN